jgi:hypothetical protein
MSFYITETSWVAMRLEKKNFNVDFLTLELKFSVNSHL